jgi:RNA polymerase sigma-70 factor (ECF subfamily)
MTAVLVAREGRTLGLVEGPARADRGTAGGDDVLLARLTAGDDRALAVAYERHGAIVHGIARRVTLDDALAVDVTQDVFVTLWERPDRVDLGRGTLRAYLCVVAHRRAVDAVRRSERRGRAERAAAASAAPVAIAATSAPADEELVAVDASLWCHDRLAVALAELPAEQREALVLAYFDGQTLKQVAECLGIPEGTAKSRVRLGLARLRALVGDDVRGAMR